MTCLKLIVEWNCSCITQFSKCNLFITISIRLAFCCNLFFHCFPLTEELCLNGTNCIYIYIPLYLTTKAPVPINNGFIF